MLLVERPVCNTSLPNSESVSKSLSTRLCRAAHIRKKLLRLLAPYLTPHLAPYLTTHLTPYLTPYLTTYLTPYLTPLLDTYTAVCCAAGLPCQAPKNAATAAVGYNNLQPTCYTPYAVCQHAYPDTLGTNGAPACHNKLATLVGDQPC